jgi:hypothetical protein
LVKKKLDNALYGKSYSESSNTKKFLVAQLKPGAALGLGGCGARIVWKDLPFLSGATLDAVMKEVHSTKEQAKQNLEAAADQKAKPKTNTEELGIAEEDFTKKREAYEKTIDISIKSEQKEQPQGPE